MAKSVESIIKDPLRYIPTYLKVMTKAVKGGASDLTSLKLWPAQREYAEGRTKRDIVVKPRQVGFSTGVMALNAHKLFTEPYTRMAIVTHNQTTSEFLLMTMRRFWMNLPREMQPRADWNSSTRIRFPDMDCLVHIDSAESKAIGFGESLNICHLSELSRWPGFKVIEQYTGISQTVSPEGYISIESTPRGKGNLFFRMYDAAKRGDNGYKAWFFPWWCHPDYQKVEVTRIDKPTVDENYLMTKMGLTPMQIAFRREKIGELGDTFFQEYPENDTDCWLGSDIAYFDVVAIRRYLQQVQQGKVEGDLTTWEDVIGGHQYVIGVDPAGGLPKGDFSVAVVLDTRSCKYVARLRGRIQPDLFSEQIFRLGLKYNQAAVAVEKQQHGHTIIRVLMEKAYPNMFQYVDYDIPGGTSVTEVGWKTNRKTKPLMIDALAQALRTGELISFSQNLLDEASNVVMDDDHTPKTPSGAFDDEIDAMMIALLVRESVPILNPFRSSNAVRSYVRL